MLRALLHGVVMLYTITATLASSQHHRKKSAADSRAVRSRAVRSQPTNVAWEAREDGGPSRAQAGLIGMRKVHDARKAPPLGGWWYYISPSAGGAKRWAFESRLANASNEQQAAMDLCDIGGATRAPWQRLKRSQ